MRTISIRAGAAGQTAEGRTVVFADGEEELEVAAVDVTRRVYEVRAYGEDVEVPFEAVARRRETLAEAIDRWEQEPDGYGYRYENLHGKVREGSTEEARSSVFYRILSGMKVGERKRAGLGSAGIKWIERTR